ncbi:DMT family transporter [Psychromarinibacter halotolerans]|uniref:DMT family transporter n=1 Tax=Psychromarinibacter halotolerans TaxID=1775175 RepID=A0ABV7GZ06_9RHOB|nr:DMT family transporter [Psychromarinibacter halotolerans]MDF0598352.1 DMT family transporter [Psychromarinibacter halotolerans]
MSSNSNPVHPDKKQMLGVALMVGVAVLSATDAVLARQLSSGVHPFVMGFTRALFGLLVFLPFILSRPGIMRSNYRVLHILRAALKLASLIAFFFAFALSPLADVTAIMFAAPIFVTIGAWVFLSESPRAIRVIAVLVGFAGVLLVLRPGQGAVSPGLVFALAGALLTAVIQLLLKPMSGRDSTETLVAWNLIATVPIAAVPAALFWTTPTPAEWGLLALQGALGALNMGMLTRAFSLAEASLLVPIDFLRLPLVAALGYLLFAQEVPLTTWIGGTVIFGATLLMARSARSRKDREI